VLEQSWGLKATGMYTLCRRTFDTLQVAFGFFTAIFFRTVNPEVVDSSPTHPAIGVVAQLVERVSKKLVYQPL
jgi:hypothetical protein